MNEREGYERRERWREGKRGKEGKNGMVGGMEEDIILEIGSNHKPIFLRNSLQCSWKRNNEVASRKVP